jgi:hypothetical protein
LNQIQETQTVTRQKETQLHEENELITINVNETIPLDLAACFCAGDTTLHNVLQDQRKIKEALEFVKRAERGWKNVLGAKHPDSKDAQTLRQEIENDDRK